MRQFWKDSYKNVYVRSEVAGRGRGTPIWHFRDWWTAAFVAIHTRNRKKTYLSFYFPEGWVVDCLADSIANAMDRVMRLYHWFKKSQP